MSTTNAGTPASRATTTSRELADEPRQSLIRRRVPFLFSVRFGITAWYAGVLILTIAVVGIGFRVLLVRTMDAQGRSRLEDAARDIRANIEEQAFVSTSSTGYAGYEIHVVPDFDSQNLQLSGVSFSIYDTSTGREIARAGNYAGVWPRRQDLPTLLALKDERYRTVTVSGYPVRTLAYPIVSEALRDAITGEPAVIGMIFATESLQSTTRMLDQMNRLLLVSGLAGAIFASIGGWLLAGRALAPVNRIMASAEDIANDRSAASLSRRVEVPATGDEIAQLAETFNDMLDRIEQAFAAQRRFVADASHELRTPLTSIKGNIDVLRRQLAAGRTLAPEDIVDALGDVGRESARMSRLVEDLLALARNESAGYGTAAGMHPTSLDVIAGEAVRTAEGLLHGQRLELDAPRPVTVTANGDQLVQVMLILLDNAIRHTPAGGTITLHVGQDIDPVDGVACARIDVEDTGHGIDPEHLPHLFERFYRAENARDRTTGGTGLGLAIALAIVRAHAGWIDVTSAPERGTRFTVWIPLRPDDVASEDATSRLRPRIPRRKPPLAPSA